MVLSLLFKAILGIKRIFHFETLSDVGFALLTGGRRVLRREALGGLLRKVSTQDVLQLLHKTEPQVKKAAVHRISVDEHCIARFTRKFYIRKGFHTIRNKKMKVEKLAYNFLIDAQQLLSLVVTPGHHTLLSIVATLIARLLPRVRGAKIRLLLDAAAAHNHGELLQLVDAHPKHTFLVRAPRRTAYRKHWASLPCTAFKQHQEPGPYSKAPAKVIHIADIQMSLRAKTPTGKTQNRPVRTVVVREQRRRGKDRWHALWIFGDEKTDAYALVNEFRQRQHHEQRHRLLVHDAYVDTAPSGYNKQSKDLHRPGFRQNALTLYAWIAGVATNVLQDWSLGLPKSLHRAHPRTLCRWLLAVPAELYQGKGTLLVVLRPCRLRPLWRKLIAQANRHPVRLPWFDDRRVLFSLDAPYRVPRGTPN